MTRVSPPLCPSCLRSHWDTVAAETAANHCHMSVKLFRKLVREGRGPAPSLADAYEFPRYSVLELDRWRHATREQVAA